MDVDQSYILLIVQHSSSNWEHIYGNLQGADHMDRERQRTSQQVQVLQTQVAAMRAEQEALRKRLQDKLLTQEKAAADKSKEFAALKRAGETGDIG